MAEVTPMMQQYMETKKQYAECILFYRLGDVYEMFFQDALKVTKELEITLTGKACGLEERAPMCGVPYHAAEGYLTKLVSRGYKVAICEQTEDPALAKGIVQRDISRIITPGTVTESCILEESKNNYIGCLYGEDGRFGLAFCDVSVKSFLELICFNTDPELAAVTAHVLEVDEREWCQLDIVVEHISENC